MITPYATAPDETPARGPMVIPSEFWLLTGSQLSGYAMLIGPCLPSQFLKQLRQGPRIVSGLVHSDCARRTRLRFFLARICQAQEAPGILDAHISQRATRAARHRTQEAAPNSRHSLRHPGLLH